jgi:hypothetical protein
VPDSTPSSARGNFQWLAKLNQFSLGHDLRVDHRPRRARVSVRRVQRRSVLPRTRTSRTNSDTARFPRWSSRVRPRHAGRRITPLTATELTTTSATVQVARIGLARELTQTAVEDSIVGRALYVMGYVMDAAQSSTASTTTRRRPRCSRRSRRRSGPRASRCRSRRWSRRRLAAHQQGARRERHLAPRQPAQAAPAGAGPGDRRPRGRVLLAQRRGRAVRRLLHGLPDLGSGLNPTSTGDASARSGRSIPSTRRWRMVMKRPPSSLTETNILNDSNVLGVVRARRLRNHRQQLRTSIRSVNA